MFFQQAPPSPLKLRQPRRASAPYLLPRVVSKRLSALTAALSCPASVSGACFCSHVHQQAPSSVNTYYALSSVTCSPGWYSRRLSAHTATLSCRASAAGACACSRATRPRSSEPPRTSAMLAWLSMALRVHSGRTRCNRAMHSNAARPSGPACCSPAPHQHEPRMRPADRMQRFSRKSGPQCEKAARRRASVHESATTRNRTKMTSQTACLPGPWQPQQDTSKFFMTGTVMSGAWHQTKMQRLPAPHSASWQGHYRRARLAIPQLQLSLHYQSHTLHGGTPVARLPHACTKLGAACPFLSRCCVKQRHGAA